MRYSVPHGLIDERVWVRVAGEQVVVTHVGSEGPVEVARHPRSGPGRPQINDEHYPPRPPGPLDRQPRARHAEEAAFLGIGQGAAQWLLEAAAAGAPRVRAKMAEATTLAKLHGNQVVDQALGTAALAGRFDDGDLAAILDHQRQHPSRGTPWRAGETHSLPSRHRCLVPARPRVGDRRADRRPAMSPTRPPAQVTAPAGDPLQEATTLARRLRLPYLRTAAAEVIPTARAQRWDPAELLRVLLAEEAHGRDVATVRNRRHRAGFPAASRSEARSNAWSTPPRPRRP